MGVFGGFTRRKPMRPLSIIMKAALYAEAQQESLEEYGAPAVGSTSHTCPHWTQLFTTALRSHAIEILVDGNPA